MGDVAQRGPLAGLELELIGDRLKKGIKRRDAFKGSFAMLGALAVATGVGKGTTAEAAVASLGLLPDPVRAEEVPGLEAAVTPAGALRTRPDLWPERGGMDGFFVARFRARE